MKSILFSLSKLCLLLFTALFFALPAYSQYVTPTFTPSPIPTLAQPGGRTHTCNAAGTAVTVRWNAVAGASRYTARLDYQGPMSGPAQYNWPSGINDVAFDTNLLNYTFTITPGTRYQWAVSAWNSASPAAPGSWSWVSPEFSCSAPVSTPTPYVQIRARNPQGALVNVRGMSYTYDCGVYPLCFSTVSEYVSSVDRYGYHQTQGGSGISLYSDQIILGVSPAPAGGNRNTRNNNGSGGSSWQNFVNWHNYWWPNFPPSGNTGTVTYIVASITPTFTPTPTPTPYCLDPDGGNNTATQGTTTAGFTNGTSNTATDACVGSIITGTYRSSVTEYSCIPPAGGGGASGTTRTSTTISCGAGYGCSGATGSCTCIPLSSPGTISVSTQDASGNVTPESRTISWSAVTGASHYYLRIDDESNGWTGACPAVNSGDVCNNNVSGTSTTYNFIAGRSYRIWVHAASACTYSSPSTLINRQTPYCTDTVDNGNVPNTYGTTINYPVGSSSTTNPDTCGTTFVTNSSSMTTTVTEYSCQPPATGSSTGTSMTTGSVACAAGRACFNGACILTPDLTYNPDATPDITRSCVAGGLTGNLTVRYCNTGAAAPSTNNTFRISYTRTNPLPNVVVTTAPIAMPAAGACTTVTQPISVGTFGVTCDSEIDIQVHLDSTLNVPESNDNNNISVFSGPAIPGEVFYKLRNASLHRLRAVDVPIPNPVARFDNTDDTFDQLYIIGSGGVVTSNQARTRILSASGDVSTNDWKKDDSVAYTETNSGWLSGTPYKFLEYARAQKKNREINNVSQITDADTVYIWTGATPVTLPANITPNNVVIVVQGNVTLTGPVFNSAVRSIAVISSGTITIPATMTTANAILIGNTITVGTSTTAKLKVKGNLISNAMINMSTASPVRNAAPANVPNLFVVVDPKMYMDLLPLISEITLQGRQVE